MLFKQMLKMNKFLLVKRLCQLHRLNKTTFIGYEEKLAKYSEEKLIDEIESLKKSLFSKLEEMIDYLPINWEYLDNNSLKILKKSAKQLNIKGYYRMTKDELISAIKQWYNEQIERINKC